jgi:hypothetical protein
MASGQQWGMDPHGPNPLGASFEPEYVCIIYFKFDDPKKTMIRQGYFATSSIPAGMTEKTFAEKMLKEASKAKTSKDWLDNPTGDKRKEFNFNGFTFGHAARIYMLVDNDNVRFDDRKTDVGTPEERYANLVRFTELRVDKDAADFRLIPADQNYSFYGATLTDLSGRKGLMMDNIYRTEDGGTPSKDNPRIYSMNFHLFWDAVDKEGKLTSVPIVIDPDGGNVGSQP